MKATIPYAEKKFSEFNELYFEALLPPIPIQLTKARTFLGKVTYKGVRDFFGNIVKNKDFLMKISCSFDLPENELEDVIIHEMIHYYIAWRNIRDTGVHGQVFRQMMTQINRNYGRNVSCRYNGDTKPELSSSSRAAVGRIVCVSCFTDGRYGLTVCATTKAYELKRSLPRYFPLRAMSWFYSEDAFFHKFPRSKTPKIYKVVKSDLDLHLRDARVLEWKGRELVL